MASSRSLSSSPWASPSGRSTTGRRSPPACRTTATCWPAPSRQPPPARTVPRPTLAALGRPSQAHKRARPAAGHRVPVRAPDRPLRRAPLRLGLPRPARRVRDRQDARHQGQGGRTQHGHRQVLLRGSLNPTLTQIPNPRPNPHLSPFTLTLTQVQRGVPRDRDALLGRVAEDSQAHRPLDRVRHGLLLTLTPTLTRTRTRT